ncbi:MAG: MarR family transcriptional regulator [Rhodospirillales bacterium]|nr:MarR family transcriptional regulator [Rhodospirillales bacterium]
MQPAAKLDAVPSATKPGECEYVLETQIGHLLRRAHQRHVAQFEKEVGDLDLTPTQFAALAKISERGEVSQNLLGRMTAMDPATIQGVIQRLMARGLIDRRPDPNDRRATLLRLSAPGRTLTREAIRRAHHVSKGVLEPLTPDDRAQLTALLRKLTDLT